MKRKTSGIPTRIYEYGCLPPTQGAEQIDAQILAAHRYYNVLIEIERGRREKYAELLAQHNNVAPLHAVVEALEATIEARRTVIKTARTRNKRGSKELSTETAPLKAEVTELSARIKLARAELKKAKLGAKEDPVLVEKLDTARKATLAKIRAARAECGVYWGTYQLVEEAVATSRRFPTPPHFKKFDGAGRVGVQLQGGFYLKELFSCEDLRFQMQPVPEDAWTGSRGEQKKKTRTVVRVRINTDDKRNPVWAELPVVLHRPLPADADIKFARVYRRRIGPAHVLTKNGRNVPTWKWFLQIVLESKEFFAPPKTSTAARPTLSIDLGWRGYDNGKPLPGIRLGYWTDSEGAHGELLVPENIVKRLEFTYHLHGIKEDNFNAMKAQLSSWLKTVPTLPDWLKEKTANLAQWKSPGRMIGLLSQWTKARFEGDSAPVEWVPPWRAKALETEGKVLGVPANALPRTLDMVGWLTEWRRQDEHLWSWEAHQRGRVLRYRREIYRNLSVGFAKKYGRIVVEELDLRDFASYPKPEDGPKSEDESSRHHRTQAAPSEFRGALKEAAEKHGVHYKYVNPKNTTRTCNSCGVLNIWKAAKAIHHTCSGCGKNFDQDQNAALNILALDAAPKTEVRA